MPMSVNPSTLYVLYEDVLMYHVVIQYEPSYHSLWPARTVIPNNIGHPPAMRLGDESVG
jgi:hypothetical protein